MKCFRLYSFIMICIFVAGLFCSCSQERKQSADNLSYNNSTNINSDDYDDEGTDGKSDDFESNDFMSPFSSNAADGSQNPFDTTAPSSTVLNTFNPQNTPAANTPVPTPAVTDAPTASTEVTVIKLSGMSADISGGGATVSDSALYINKEGTYQLSGAFSGQIVVEVKKTERVYLSLGGVELSGSKNAAIWVKSADKVVIILENGTVNTVTDNPRYTGMNAQSEPNACIFSKDDLTIKGEGTLNVTGLFSNGIMSKDDLKITGGTINIKAQKNGLRGNDSISIGGGTISIDAGKDGIKVTNDTDDGKGFILIENGTVNIKCKDDGLQASKTLTISGGKVHIDAKGKDVNCDGDVNIKDGCLV